jgi:three-Cys-motif partner protein
VLALARRYRFSHSQVVGQHILGPVPKKIAGQIDLFDIGSPTVPAPPKIPADPAKVPGHFWSGCKARLIEGYLFLFLQVTKHGTYIDGFAGPQVAEDLDGWSAGRVIRGQRGRDQIRLQHFHLFDTDARKAPILQALADSRPDLDICVYPRDFNTEVVNLLRPEVIRPTEATFCLLDQHTFECRWSTLQALAAYKSPKIELFYFFAEGWLNRALANTTVNQADLTAWWGGEGWQSLPGMSGRVRADLLAERFRGELGYTYSRPFPVFRTREAQQVFYYMVHASDHPAAIEFMVRAYREAVSPKEPVNQPTLPIDLPLPTTTAAEVP